jgi:hypothetical protein
VSSDDTTVSTDFTERWFRDSGLYDLSPQYQEKLLGEFIADKCNWRKEKVQKEAAKYRDWLGYVQIARDTLANSITLDKIGVDILKTAKAHQQGRTPDDGVATPFNFTQWWFRTSGLYDLSPAYQKKLNVCADKVPQVLSLAKQHQTGRGTEEVPNGTFGTNIIVLAKHHQKGRVPSLGTMVPTSSIQPNHSTGRGYHQMVPGYHWHGYP